MKRLICVFLCALLAAFGAVMLIGGSESKDGYIKYAEFNVTSDALQRAVSLDISTHESENHIDCVTLLAYLGAKYGGDFSKYKSGDIDEFAELAQNVGGAAAADELSADMPYYSYYLEVYGAVLGGMVGQTESGAYGLTRFCPIAAGFAYSCFSDFGTLRTYGYTRPHLGHDLMAAVGTPVIAVESGTVEALGWNRYGGWRIGIRSADKKRYWYYAHLRKNRPYAEGLSEGDEVKAGDVIGYVGRTGYSSVENTNGIEESHLHLGLELIFDESQKESDNEIWIDLTAITELLEQNKSEVTRNSETKEFTRVR